MKRVQLFAATLAASLALASTVYAQDAPGPGADAVNEAREHFQKALKLNAAGKVDEALVEFQKAYDLSPNWRLLYNIGQTSRVTRDYVRSIKAFQRFLDDGAGDVPRQKRAEVEREIATLKGLAGRIEIAAPDGAKVSVDSAVVGTAPLAEPIVVNPGSHKISAETGATPVEAQVEVKSGELAKIRLDVKQATQEPKPPNGGTKKPGPEPERPSPPRDNGTLITVSAVATGLLTLGAVGTGVWAIVTESQLEDARYAGPDRRPPDGTEAHTLVDRIDTLAIVTDVLAAGAIVAAGLTIVFIATDGPSAPAKGSVVKPASARLHVGPRALSLSGSF